MKLPKSSSCEYCEKKFVVGEEIYLICSSRLKYFQGEEEYLCYQCKDDLVEEEIFKADR